MSDAVASREGYIPYAGRRVWHRVVGDGEAEGRLPLLCLHGGPGVPHDYLEPLAALAATGRRVVFYDQLGGGNSDRLEDFSLCTVPFYLGELDTVRASLGLERVHLLGQSWGGMLALEHALAGAPGLASLTLADTPASMPLWAAETNRLRSQLPAGVRAVLDAHEAAGTTDHPAYEEAMMIFYGKHVCRLDPWPECLTRSFEKMLAAPQVYQTMVGPSEFYVTGSLKEWDATPRLGEISAPTLVLGGRHDEATPLITEALHQGIPGSEWVIFENSSHLPHLEEPERFLAVVSDFLARAEA